MQKGDFIRIKYSGKIKENKIPLDQAENAPIIVGGGWILQGFDEALLEMNLNDKKTVEIPSEKGFGPRDPKLVKLVPESEFKKHGKKPFPGMWVDADQRRGRVLSVSSGRVKIDFNHPLAGKTVIYDVEIKEKIEKPEDKVRAIVEFFSRQPADKVKIDIKDKEIEIVLPPMVNSLYKKRIADEVMKYLEKDKVKFIEEFRKVTEEDKKKAEELSKKLPITEVK